MGRHAGAGAAAGARLRRRPWQPAIQLVAQVELWPKAIPRIVTQGIAPEQALVGALCAGVEQGKPRGKVGTPATHRRSQQHA